MIELIFLYIVYVRHCVFYYLALYPYDFDTTDCFNLAFVLRDYNKRIHPDGRTDRHGGR